MEKEIIILDTILKRWFDHILMNLTLLSEIVNDVVYKNQKDCVNVKNDGRIQLMSNNNLNQARECCLRENNLCGKTKSCETSCRYMRNVARLWDGFCDTPVEYDGCIKEEWNTFPIGTARANIVDWFCKTFEVDIDALKEMTEREINTDIGDHRQKSVYEIYAEQTTVEEMEKAWKTFQKEK